MFNVLSKYMQGIFAEKGDGKPIPLQLLDCPMAPDSTKIQELEVFGNTGHDLSTFKIRDADDPSFPIIILLTKSP